MSFRKISALLQKVPSHAPLSYIRKKTKPDVCWKRKQVCYLIFHLIFYWVIQIRMKKKINPKKTEVRVLTYLSSRHLPSICVT